MPELVDVLRDYEQVTRVIRAFETGGRITNMTVSMPVSVFDPNKPPPPSTPFPFGGVINTMDMDYPPQMIETIKSYLMQRQKKFADELEALGVIVPVDEMK